MSNADAEEGDGCLFFFFFFFLFLFLMFDFDLLLLLSEEAGEGRKGKGSHCCAWRGENVAILGHASCGVDGWMVRVLLPAWLLTCLPGWVALLSRGAACELVFLVFSCLFFLLGALSDAGTMYLCRLRAVLEHSGKLSAMP